GWSRAISSASLRPSRATAPASHPRRRPCEIAAADQSTDNAADDPSRSQGETPMYRWDFDVLWQHWDLFMYGLWLTVVYTFGSILFGILIGAVTCAARLSGWRVLSLIART